MDKLVIRGGYELRGEVCTSGAKNAVLPILCASILTKDELRLSNIPQLQDVATLLSLLRYMGVSIKEGKNNLSLNSANINLFDAPYERVKTMRASILVLGPLLARFGSARVSLPGGCAIGSRPVDLHIKGLEAMGARVVIEHGYIIANATHLPNQRLQGTEYYMDAVTVTGTENLMMAAVLAEGTTVLENSAKEPEVSDLANCLVKMGAKIQGIGTDTLTIEGVENLNGAEHTVIGDRIEASTYLMAVAIAKGEVVIKNIAPKFMEAILFKLNEAGVQIQHDENNIFVKNDRNLNPVNIVTAPYPAFPTDCQAQFMALNSVAKGTSLITESIFENRFMHVQELKRLGANIEVHGNIAQIQGVSHLKGASVMATDLRASASLVLAGLVAQGETIIERIYHLDRGYEALELKLTALGAKVARVH